jgi:hypothetical protein
MLHKYWCTLPEDDPQRGETFRSSSDLIVQTLNHNTLQQLSAISWISTISDGYEHRTTFPCQSETKLSVDINCDQIFCRSFFPSALTATHMLHIINSTEQISHIWWQSVGSRLEKTTRTKAQVAFSYKDNWRNSTTQDLHSVGDKWYLFKYWGLQFVCTDLFVQWITGSNLPANASIKTNRLRVYLESRLLQLPFLNLIT